MGRMCTAQWTRRPGASGRLIVLVLAIEKILLALASESITDKKKKKKKTILKNILKKKVHKPPLPVQFLSFSLFFFLLFFPLLLRQVPWISLPTPCAFRSTCAR